MRKLSDVLETIDQRRNLPRVWKYLEDTTRGPDGRTTVASVRMADDAMVELVERIAASNRVIDTLEEIEADETRNCWDMYKHQLDRAEKAEAEVNRLHEQFAYALSLLRRARYEGDDKALVELDDVLEANAEAKS